MTDTDHTRCPEGSHDRSLPDEGGRPYDQPYDEHGFLSDKQAIATDGLLGCNDCGLPLFYCRVAEWYFHVDPDAGCFLSGAWRDSIAPETKQETEYRSGMEAGIAEAEAEAGDLMTTRVITGKSADWVAGHRVGRSKVRNARYVGRTNG